jgi:hypothetical protein
MERTAVASELKTARRPVEFSVAGPKDDAEIRRLLRENPMRGAVSISLEREPNYFAGCAVGSARDVTIVARKDGRVVCVGNCSVRMRFVNGKAMPVGYLGGLRLDSSVAGRFDILRLGYQFFETVAGHEVALFFTSIAADNLRARQFLERNLPGMPRYEFMGEFVTMVLSTRQGRGRGTVVEAEASEEFFNERQARYNLATEWQENEFWELPGFGSSMQLRNGNSVAASGVLWDQRRFKQTVVRGYSLWMKAVRPIVNVFAKFGGVRLPAAGSALSLAFLSPVTATEDSIGKLLAASMELAHGAGIQLLTIGLDARDPKLGTVRNQFKLRECRSRLYAVRWKGRAPCRFDDRILMPEVALL